MIYPHLLEPLTRGSTAELHVLRMSGRAGSVMVSGSGLDPLESEARLRHLRTAFPLVGTNVRIVPMILPKVLSVVTVPSERDTAVCSPGPHL